MRLSVELGRMGAYNLTGNPFKFLKSLQMKKIHLSIIILLIFNIHATYSQSEADSLKSGRELKALLLDMDRQTPLPYANIYVLQKNMGVISNEKGYFSMDISELEETDTIRFQYIGYQTKNLSLTQLNGMSIVYLKEDIINLNEALIFGSIPKLETIVKNVLKHKDSNYRKTTSRKQSFFRKRDNVDLVDIKIKYKKSSIPELDREMIQFIQDRIPKHTTSYTDFLGDLYFNKNEEDSIKFKVDAIRTVSLKEKEIAELDQIERVFEDIIANTSADEYWKIRSGIFGDKVDMGDDSTNNKEEDTLYRNRRNLKHQARSIKHQLKFSSFEDKDTWEFLHNTGKYKYTLVGGARVNGEEVYIIDFKPRYRGTYMGRMYIAINSFALIRADFEYAPEKTGTDIQILGVGYTENIFQASIYFEKKDNTYALKYFSHKAGSTASFDRSLALIKKKSRSLFDKKLNELKLGIDLTMNMEESIEFLVLEARNITDQEFSDFTQKEYLEVIFVDQFDDNLWKGYSIIEPTQQMKEYKKQDINYMK